MGLGRISFEAVDKTSLGRAEGEPIAPGLLQCNKKLPTAIHRLFVQFVAAVELDLEGVLAAHWTVRAALAPDGDIRFSGVAAAEIQYSKVLKHFLDDGLVYQFDSVAVGRLQWR